MQVAIQDGAGNYWGGATFNQASIFYNATGGTVAAWTYATAHPRRPADQRPHLHDHRQLDRPGRQHRHDDAHLRLRHRGADGHERHLDQGRRRLPGRHADPGHRHLQRERDRHRHADPRAQLAAAPRATAPARGSSTLTFNYTVGAADNSADLDYIATNSLALAGGTIKDAATNNATLTLPTVGGASSIGGQKAIVVDTTNPTASVTTPAVDGNTLQRDEPPGQPRRLLGRHRRLRARLDRAGRDPGRRRQLLGRRHLQPGLDLLQRNRRHHRRLDLRRPQRSSASSLNGHTYTITARSTDAAGNTGTTTRTFVFDSTRRR